jgi:hypothetical protein
MVDPSSEAPIGGAKEGEFVMDKLGKKKGRFVGRLSIFTTILVIVFEVVFLGPLRFVFDPPQWAAINEWVWAALLAYLSIEFLDTADRDSSNWKTFALDSGLALISCGVAGTLMILHYAVPAAQMGDAQWQVLLKFLCFTFVDLALGAILSLRIAFAGKEREGV